MGPQLVTLCNRICPWLRAGGNECGEGHDFFTLTNDAHFSQFGSAKLTFTLIVQPPFGQLCNIQLHVDQELNTMYVAYIVAMILTEGN